MISYSKWRSNSCTGLYRPWRIPGGWWQSAHEGGKVVSPTHRPPLAPRKYAWCPFLLEAESTPGPSTLLRMLWGRHTFKSSSSNSISKLELKWETKEG
jgi:hypothetical protein